jgi:hypothetical protein
MNVIEIREFLLCSITINYGVLCIWFEAFRFAHDSLYRLHSHWFKLSVETFDALHYGGMADYKVGILLLNMTPLLALFLLGH